MKKLISFFKKYYVFLTPLLFWMAFLFSSSDIYGIFSICSWVCLVPIIIFLRNKSIKKIYIISFTLGLIANYTAFGWMKFFGSGVPGGEFLISILLTPLLSAFWVSKFFLSEFLRKKFPSLSILIYPCIWMFFDFIKSIGFLAFPWTYLGYTQYHFDSLIQMTSYTGVFGITWIIVLVNVILAELFINYNNKKIFKRYLFTSLTIAFGIVCIIFSGIYRINYYSKKHALEKNKDFTKVGFVQSCISPFDDWENNKNLYLNDLVNLSNEILKDKEDTELILWTESSTLEYLTFDYINNNLNFFEKTVLNYAKDNNVSIVTGEVGVRIGQSKYKFYNSAAFIDNTGNIIGNYSKIFLAPFGEWFPYEKWFPWVQNILDGMQAAAFSPGESPEIFNINGKNFGMLICYESMFFRLSRIYDHMNTDFMVIITNDGWTDYYKGHMQHFCATKFRAIETGMYYLRAGNTGYTAIVNPLGIVEKSIPILKKTYMTGEFDSSFKIDTFYSKYGDMFFYSIELIFIIILTFFFLRRYILIKLRSKNEN